MIAVTAAKLIWKLAPANRLGPEQQHDQRADRDQPQADRVAAKRDPAEHQQARRCRPRTVGTCMPVSKV